MSKNTIISGFVGALLGAGISWFITNCYWGSKNKDEIEAYKTYFNNKIKKLEDQLNIGQTEPKLIDIPNQDAKVIEESKPISYHSIIKDHYNIETDDISDDEDFIKEREIENKPKEKPYLIHMDAFTGDDDIHYQSEYSHISLDYFAGDNKVTLMDTNELLDNPDKVLGYDWRLHFGDEKFGYDENTVYVRNDVRRVDYEIVRDKGYYCQIILGIDPPDEEE